MSVELSVELGTTRRRGSLATLVYGSTNRREPGGKLVEAKGWASFLLTCRTNSMAERVPDLAGEARGPSRRPRSSVGCPPVKDFFRSESGAPDGGAAGSEGVAGQLWGGSFRTHDQYLGSPTLGFSPFRCNTRKI